LHVELEIGRSWAKSDGTVRLRLNEACVFLFLPPALFFSIKSMFLCSHPPMGRLLVVRPVAAPPALPSLRAKLSMAGMPPIGSHLEVISGSVLSSTFVPSPWHPVLKQ
jgi:hypothetical protein